MGRHTVTTVTTTSVAAENEQQNTPPAAESKRNPTLDLIRSCAIIAVVTLHIMPQSEHVWSYRIFVESMSKVGVPLFLILSEYLMLNRDYTTPNRLKRFFTHN